MSDNWKERLHSLRAGSRGIGAAIAKRLAADGANVAITYTKGADAARVGRPKRLNALAERRSRFRRTPLMPAPSKPRSKRPSRHSPPRRPREQCGHGHSQEVRGDHAGGTERLIDINVRGTFVATQAALKQNEKRRPHHHDRLERRRACHDARARALLGHKGSGQMFTQGLSREVGSRGITVNNIQPGPIDTDLNPAAGDWAVPQKANTALDRYGSVDEVAALVAFVAGPEASYITGANLTVDGGTNAYRKVNQRGVLPPGSLRKPGTAQ